MFCRRRNVFTIPQSQQYFELGGNFLFIQVLGSQYSNRPRGVTVSTLDSESSDRGSNPRESFPRSRGSIKAKPGAGFPTHTAMRTVRLIVMKSSVCSAALLVVGKRTRAVSLRVDFTWLSHGQWKHGLVV